MIEYNISNLIEKHIDNSETEADYILSNGEMACRVTCFKSTTFYNSTKNLSTIDKPNIYIFFYNNNIERYYGNSFEMRNLDNLSESYCLPQIKDIVCVLVNSYIDFTVSVVNQSVVMPKIYRDCQISSGIEECIKCDVFAHITNTYKVKIKK